MPNIRIHFLLRTINYIFLQKTVFHTNVRLIKFEVFSYYFYHIRKYARYIVSIKQHRISRRPYCHCNLKWWRNTQKTISSINLALDFCISKFELFPQNISLWILSPMCICTWFSSEISNSSELCITLNLELPWSVCESLNFTVASTNSTVLLIQSLISNSANLSHKKFELGCFSKNT